MSEETFHYQLLESLGRGASGEVFLGEASSDRLNERWPVVLKVLDAPYPRILRHEAQRLRALRVKGVVGPIDVIALEAFPGRSILVTEHVPGVNLLQIVEITDGRGETVPARAVFQLGAAIFDLLAAIHGLSGAPLLHRSLTPADIRLSIRGEVAVVDFAVHSEPSAHALPFSAPEHAEIDHPAGDVYAAAAVLLWAMGVDDDADTATQREQALELVGPSPDGLRAVELLLHALSRRPEDRPTARALADALGEAARGLSGVNLPLFAARVVPLASASADAPPPSQTRGIRWFPVGWREFLIAAVLMLVPVLLIVIFTIALVTTLNISLYFGDPPSGTPTETAPAPSGFHKSQPVP